MLVGVLGLQGDFREHLDMLSTLDVETLDVRTSEAINRVDGLIIPGGESTTLARLLRINELEDVLKDRIQNDMPVYGTCAGAILLSHKVKEGDPEPLGLMDIDVSRNAYGRQINSFEVMLNIDGIGDFCGIFIRAPKFTRVGSELKVLASLEEQPVLVQQNSMLAGAFHPELSGDSRVHAYFVKMIQDSIS